MSERHETEARDSRPTEDEHRPLRGPAPKLEPARA